MKPGYYLVTPDGERRFISATLNPDALNRLCDMTDSEMLDWLEKANGLEICQDGTEWTRPDGSKFVSRFLLSANGTRFSPHPTLRETIRAAMEKDSPMNELQSALGLARTEVLPPGVGEHIQNLKDALLWALCQIEDDLDPDHQAALAAARALVED